MGLSLNDDFVRRVPGRGVTAGQTFPVQAPDRGQATVEFSSESLMNRLDQVDDMEYRPAGGRFDGVRVRREVRALQHYGADFRM